MVTLQQQFGQIDIYLFDQILRGRIAPGMKILDAGCGEGRNLVYLLREGYEVFGVDHDPEAIAYVRRLAGHLAPALSRENFQTAMLGNIPHPDAFFDAVICNAVLHFAQDDRHFNAMLRGIWRVLKPGGVFFCRLASSIGMEKKVKRLSGRRYLLPDQSERYLVDEACLETLTRELQAELLDPIKTTIVQNQRCMTTWMLMKR